MNAEKPSLSVALKTLWGAAEMPFGDACPEPYRYPGFEELIRRLQQLCDIGASGLLYGPNGIGKSYLCGCFTEKLPDKRYKILSLAHSSLSGSDLIRALCRQLSVEPQMRRSDNVANIHGAFAQLGSRWPLLVLEEAQNLSASALEEVRLLTCARPDTRAPFSLLLVGDESLLPRLQMGINRALISRLGFALALSRLEPAQSPHWDGDIFQRGKLVHQEVELEYETDELAAFLRKIVVGKPRHILPPDGDGSFIRYIK